MSRNTPTARTAATAALALALWLGAGAGPWPRPVSSARADQAGQTEAPRPLRRPVSRDASSPRGAVRPPQGTGGWWLGTAGVALALAACGWASTAARRFRPGGAVGPVAVRVVGRTSLSPKHSVYLLEVGRRVLVVGTGPQGAPSLLGELTDEAPAGRLDLRLGDDA